MSLTWEDISTICPICYARMDQVPYYYGSAKCPNGHYELSSGNYHVDVFIEDKWAVHFDEMDPPEVEENYKKLVAEARKKWMSKEKFTFFWDGPFSQWEPSEFEIDGVIYNCAEQYMMAMKAKMFGDEDTYERIMEEDSPREQKKLGRQVKGFDAERWNIRAREIVYEGNHAKFTQNPELLDKLIATRGTTLVEASPYDCVWGVGLSEDDPAIRDRDNWRGTNWLGETLTGLREDLIEEGY